MRNQLLVALAVLPLAAFAQGGPGPGPGRGMGPGDGMGQGRGMRHGGRGLGDPEKMEKRMRLARTLGLAEALDLEPAQALKLGEAVARFDEKRLALHRQVRDARDVLRRAARGDEVKPAEIDQAIQRTVEARLQLHAIDRDVLATVTKDLPPEKKARAALFLEKFQGRFGPARELRGRAWRAMGREGAEMGMRMGMGPPGDEPAPDWDDDE
jgi:hypothetical protein